MLVDQRHIQLDHVRTQQRQQCQGALVSPDIVKRDPEPRGAHPLHGLQQLSGPGGQRTLGDLKEDVQPAA